jgi:hypothetical protein
MVLQKYFGGGAKILTVREFHAIFHSCGGGWQHETVL